LFRGGGSGSGLVAREGGGAAEHLLYVVAILSAVALAFPLITTVNEFLTQIAIQVGLFGFIQSVVVPQFARVVGGILSTVFGIKTVVFSKAILLEGWGKTVLVVINWNCVGWQSLVLLALTLLMGLLGPYTLRSRLECVLIGVQGVILLNILRVIVFCLLILQAGYPTAVIFHDYGGTLMTLLYLAGFWHLSYSHILKQHPAPESLGV